VVEEGTTVRRIQLGTRGAAMGHNPSPEGRILFQTESNTNDMWMHQVADVARLTEKGARMWSSQSRLAKTFISDLGVQIQVLT